MVFIPITARRSVLRRASMGCPYIPAAAFDAEQAQDRPQQKIESQSTFVGRGSHLSIRNPGFRPFVNALPQFSKPFHGAAHIIMPGYSLRHQPCDRLIVSSNDNFFSPSDSVQQLAKTCFRIEGNHRSHDSPPNLN